MSIVKEKKLQKTFLFTALWYKEQSFNIDSNAGEQRIFDANFAVNCAIVAGTFMFSVKTHAYCMVSCRFSTQHRDMCSCNPNDSLLDITLMYLKNKGSV